MSHQDIVDQTRRISRDEWEENKPSDLIVVGEADDISVAHIARCGFTNDFTDEPSKTVA